MCSYCTKDIQTGEEAHVRSGARAGNFTVAPGSPVEQPLLLSGMWDRGQEEGCVMGGITAYPAPDRPPCSRIPASLLHPIRPCAEHTAAELLEE